MLREHSRLVIHIHMILDVCWVILAFIAAYYTKRNCIFFSGQGLSTGPNYYLVLLLIIISALCSFSITGCYRPYRTQTLRQVYIRAAKAVLGTLFGTIILLYLTHEYNVSRMLLLLFIFFLSVLLLLSKGGDLLQPPILSFTEL